MIPPLISDTLETGLGITTADPPVPTFVLSKRSLPCHALHLLSDISPPTNDIFLP